MSPPLVRCLCIKTAILRQTLERNINRLLWLRCCSSLTRFSRLIANFHSAHNLHPNQKRKISTYDIWHVLSYRSHDCVSTATIKCAVHLPEIIQKKKQKTVSDRELQHKLFIIIYSNNNKNRVIQQSYISASLNCKQGSRKEQQQQQ